MKKFFFLATALFLASAELLSQSTPPAETPYVTIDVANNSTIQIDLKAAEQNTSVWIETSEGNYIETTVGTSLTGFVDYTASDTILKVYGDIANFNCSYNNSKLKGLDFSSGFTNLTKLKCYNNQISSLNVDELSSLTYLSCTDNNLDSLCIKGLTNLKELYCFNNNIDSLFFSGLTNLEVFNCSSNNLNYLDFSSLPSLIKLYCYGNDLENLDVSNLENLVYLNCRENNLNDLDIRNLSSLSKLYCSNNNFTTQVIDDIYCTLPERESGDGAEIEPAFSSTDTYYDQVLASNAQNARDKNWAVEHFSDDSDINTTGTYECGSTPSVYTPYIMLKVTNGASIDIDMNALADNTPAWVEASEGDYTQISLGQGWLGVTNYIASDTIIKVYGNIAGFSCINNGSKLTGLSFSNELTNLNKLKCYGNNFSTQIINDIYCNLPFTDAENNAVLYISNNESDNNHTDILSSNAQNAKDKNWDVWYYDNNWGALNNTDIPTTGTYNCDGTVSVSSLQNIIELIVYPNPATQSIKIEVASEMIGSDIRIYNQLGKQIISQRVDSKTNTVDISSLNKGVYVLKVGEKTSRLIKN